MPAIKHSILLTMSVLAAYLFLQLPGLKTYAPQLFALIAVIYLVLQRRANAGHWLLLPQSASPNLALINLAFLLLVGGSGALASPFYALTFIQLFFLVMAAEQKTALLVALEIMVFHLSLTVAGMQGFALGITAWSNLVVIPLVTLFYLFGKVQFQKAHYRSLLVDAEAQELWKAKSDDQAVAEFVDSLLNKRLPMLEFLLSFPEKNLNQLNAELKVLKGDLNKLLRSIQQKKESKRSVEEEFLQAAEGDETEDAS